MNTSILQEVLTFAKCLCKQLKTLPQPKTNVVSRHETVFFSFLSDLVTVKRDWTVYVPGLIAVSFMQVAMQLENASMKSIIEMLT
jgi:hypothetical protein